MSTAFRSAARSPRSALPPRPASHRSALSPVPSRPPSVTPTQKGARSQKVIPLPSQNSVVKRLPTRRSLPPGLQLLIRLQQSSRLVMFGLVIAALAVYGSMVYTQQLWSKEYSNLKKMQRNEREMVAANEALKNQLAQQAERPESGLIPRTPAAMLIVPAAPQRPVPPSSKTTAPSSKANPDTPMGY